MTAATATKTATAAPPPLADRVSAALADPGRTAASVKALLAEAEALAERLASDAAAARDRALDPARPAREVTALRAAADDLAFEADRAEAARVALADELHRLTAAEAEATRLRRRKTAQAAADQAADRLAHEWPALVRDMLGIIADVLAARALAEAANSERADGEALIADPELRGVDRGQWHAADLHDGPVRPSQSVLIGTNGRALWPLAKPPAGSWMVAARAALARWFTPSPSGVGWPVGPDAARAALARLGTGGKP